MTIIIMTCLIDKKRCKENISTDRTDPNTRCDIFAYIAYLLSYLVMR